MDKIFLKKLEFYAYHGSFLEESRLGQRFYVDLELYKDLTAAGISDDLEKTIDYGEVYQIVRQEVEEKRYKLVETLAEKIAARLLSNFLLEEVLVRVTKPDPPIAGHYQSVGVEIKRKKR